ncbi:MAG: polyprenyl synthetase family protein [Dactylosporangium sp.]|nr:polyprenyl synthetase family protein [Dactylosporangium sp.]NNJ60084.1 polyprenyl synthetase family protein [Dactylosporangium sp.]
MVIGVVSTGGQLFRAAVGFEFSDPALEAVAGATLAEVEDVLRDAAVSADPVVTEAARHLVDAGGKRFRPLLVTVAASFGDARAPKVVLAGAVVELTHLATLYHDDVMDESLVRRGAPSANARWGNSVAILVGDYLFARAAHIGADLGVDAVRLHAGTFSRLVQGQIAETIGPRPGEDETEHYLRVISEKTASLIETSTRLGGLFGGVEPHHVECLARYGETIGVAFQLSDDLLDIASDGLQSGKTPGTDLREGVRTLPMLYALASEDASPSAQRLREILAGGPVADDALHAEALGLLRESAALKRARETVREHAERARLALAPLPDLPARRALEHLSDFIVDRTC